MDRRSLVISAGGGLLSALGLPALAQTFPARPVKVVVAWPAGGFVDVATRAMTEKLAATWSQQVVVENKPGAYGLIGTEQVIRSTPDGLTWLIGTMGTPMSASLYKRKWVASDELAGVAMIGSSAVIAVVPQALPVTTLKEFVAMARSQPGKLNYLNPSIGSASHLNTELIKLREHLNITGVLYNGQPPGLVDLIAGQLHFALLAPQVAGPHIRAGKLRPLAVAFPNRLREFADLPTMAEAGYPYANVVASYPVLVPRQTPKDVIARLSADIQQALTDPDVRRRIEVAGATVAGPMTPEQVDGFMQAETQRWDRFFRETRISID